MLKTKKFNFKADLYNTLSYYSPKLNKVKINKNMEEIYSRIFKNNDVFFYKNLKQHFLNKIRFSFFMECKIRKCTTFTIEAP